MAKKYISLGDFTKDNPLVNHSSREIPLWQKGKGPYGLTIPKELLYFGDIVVGMVKVNQVELINIGFKPLYISEITLNGAGYSMPADYPKIIYPNTSVILPITFQPTDYGLSAAILRIDAGNGGVYQFSLLGQGIWDHVTAVTNMLDGLWEFLQRSVQPAIVSTGPALSLSNTSVEFTTDVMVDSQSDIVTYTISNAGNQPLIIDNLSISGDFEIVP